jgi:acetoin utilization protein AcuB
MTADPVTVREDTSIEEAARIMIDNKIGALPVMRDDVLVGIITETDVFRTFIELFAAREQGVRLTLLVPEQKGELVIITEAIAKLGGNISALGTFQGEDASNRLLTIKVDGVAQEQLVNKMKEIGAKIIDARTCEAAVAC